MKLHYRSMFLFLLGLYVWILVKVILFKLGPMDSSFLWQQLQRSLESPGMVPIRMQQGNLVPFYEITRTFQDFTSHGLLNVIGNFALFIPFGLLLSLCFYRGRLSLVGVVVSSFGLSAGFELAQAILYIGQYDVDDMILNTAGGIVGFWVKSATIIEN